MNFWPTHFHVTKSINMLPFQWKGNLAHKWLTLNLCPSIWEPPLCEYVSFSEHLSQIFQPLQFIWKKTMCSMSHHFFYPTYSDHHEESLVWGQFCLTSASFLFLLCLTLKLVTNLWTGKETKCHSLNFNKLWYAETHLVWAISFLTKVALPLKEFDMQQCMFATYICAHMHGHTHSYLPAERNPVILADHFSVRAEETRSRMKWLASDPTGSGRI